MKISESLIYTFANEIKEEYADIKPPFQIFLEKNNLMQKGKNKTDLIVNKVVESFKQRSKVGIEKYGTTLERNDLTRLDWIQHAQEEAMDLILYLEKLKSLEL